MTTTAKKATGCDHRAHLWKRAGSWLVCTGCGQEQESLVADEQAGWGRDLYCRQHDLRVAPRGSCVACRGEALGAA